jgi:hypothetical protein
MTNTKRHVSINHHFLSDGCREILSTLYINNVEGEIEELYQVLTGSDEK